MGIRRTEGSFDAAGGRSLFRRSWQPATPERLLVVAHGFAEHSGRYEGFGSWFAERGCAVHAYDHQGHGRSQGRRNYVASFDDFLDDLSCFLESVRSEHPELPCVLVGHSMGGLMVSAFARERRPVLSGLVTSGAALSLGPAFAGVRRVAVRALGTVMPKFAVDTGLSADALSRDPDVIRRYLEDPLIGTKMTASLAVEMMHAIERTQRGGRGIGMPMLLLHGAEDGVCPPDGSREFHASLSPDIAARSALTVYPGLRHEIFNEPEREQVFTDLLEWIHRGEHAERAAPKEAANTELWATQA